MIRWKSFKLIPTLLVLLVLPVIPAALNVWLSPERPPWNPMELADGEILLQELADWPSAYLLLDARSMESFEASHMPGAVNLYVGEFDSQIVNVLDLWSPDLSIIVYCDSRQCGASEEIAQRLRSDFQMENIYVLKGGWESWINAPLDLRNQLEENL